MSFVHMETGNPLGQRPLNVMARSQSLGWLGAAPTPGDYDNNQQVLGQLVAMGAISQDDANNIWSGTASLDDMAVNMTMINQALALTGQQGAQTIPPLPPSSPNLTVVPYTQPSTPAAATPSTPTSAATPQIPSGSTIVYNATYNPVAGWTTSASAISALAPLLPAHGMSLLSSNVASTGLVSNASFSVTILDSVGNALVSDAKSVLDALMQQITRNGLIQSSVAVTSAGLTPPGSAAAPAQSATAFVENNIGLLIAAAIAIVVLPGLIKKI